MAYFHMHADSRRRDWYARCRISEEMKSGFNIGEGAGTGTTSALHILFEPAIPRSGPFGLKPSTRDLAEHAWLSACSVREQFQACAGTKSMELSNWLFMPFRRLPCPASRAELDTATRHGIGERSLEACSKGGGIGRCSGL